MTSPNTKVLSPEDIDNAVMHLHDRGYTILEGAIPQEEVNAAREEYLRLFDELSSANSTRLQTSHSERFSSGRDLVVL
jgi:hypothetical protein